MVIVRQCQGVAGSVVTRFTRSDMYEYVPLTCTADTPTTTQAVICPSHTHAESNPVACGESLSTSRKVKPQSNLTAKSKLPISMGAAKRAESGERLRAIGYRDDVPALAKLALRASMLTR